jgi:Domain of unknown function (DUF4281)
LTTSIIFNHPTVHLPFNELKIFHREIILSFENKTLLELLQSQKLASAMGIPFLKFTEDELFPIVNLVFPAWALLALLPRWKYTAPIVRMVALSYSVLYVVLFFDMMVLNPINISANDFNSLDGLLNFFSYKSAMFVGWVHYIAFDLWTGM